MFSEYISVVRDEKLNWAKAIVLPLGDQVDNAVFEPQPVGA